MAEHGENEPGKIRPRHGSEHPLGPLVYRVSDDSSHRVRVRAGAVLACCLAVIVVGRVLHPDPSGAGTHAQLGFPQCGLLVLTGVPCPTCGMTTAFALVMRGRLLTALTTQPFGALLAMGTLAAAALCIAALITGRGWRVNWFRVSPGWLAGAGVLLFLAAWGYKILAVRAGQG
jgi:hypothetical protein